MVGDWDAVGDGLLGARTLPERLDDAKTGEEFAGGLSSFLDALHDAAFNEDDE